MKYQVNKKGETLIEVIAALTSLVLAGVAVMTLIISVMSSTAISKEYLIAQNLAREGIEGVINIRDTNWLLYPSEKDAKWLEINENGFYILENSSDKFSLEEKGVADVKNDVYKLELQSVPTFFRQITFDEIDADTIQVNVKIYWESKSNPTTYELSSILVNYEK